MADHAATLYARLGGYDAIAAVPDDLLPRLMSLYYTGRDMPTSHKGMGISARDWGAFSAKTHLTGGRDPSYTERQAILAGQGSQHLPP